MIRSLTGFFSIIIAAAALWSCTATPPSEAERLAAAIDRLPGAEVDAMSRVKSLYDSIAGTVEPTQRKQIDEWLANHYDNRLDTAALVAYALSLKPDEAGRRIAKAIVERVLNSTGTVSEQSAQVESTLTLTSVVYLAVKEGKGHADVVSAIDDYVNSLPIERRAELLVRTGRPEVLGELLRDKGTPEEIAAVRALYTGRNLQLFENALNAK